MASQPPIPTLGESLPASPLPPMIAAPAIKPSTPDEMWDAGRRLAREDRADADDLRLQEGYDPIVKALGLRDTQNPAFFNDVDGPLGIGSKNPLPNASDLVQRDGPTSYNHLVFRQDQEELVAGAIRAHRLHDPGFLAGVPDNVAGLHDYFLKQEAEKRRAAQSTMARSPGFLSGTLPSFAGGALETMLDPPNLLTIPFGGGGAKTLLQVAGREALLNGLIELGEQPIVAANRAELGDTLSPGEATTNVLTAAFGGAVLGGGFHLGGKGLGRVAAPVYDRTIENVFNAMPDAIQRRWADRATLPDGQLLVDVFRQHVPEEFRTPDERAAMNVVETGAADAASSPFAPGIAGGTEHQVNLGDALQEMLSGERRPASPPVPDVPPEQVSAGQVQSLPQGAGGGAAVSTSGRPNPLPGEDAIAAFKARVAHAESPGDHVRNAMGSSASGRYQFTDGTFRSYYRRIFGTDPGAHPVEGLKNDPAVQEPLMDALTRDNAARLQSIREPVTTGNLYLMHVFGERDGPRILKADPQTPIAALLSADAITKNKLEGKSASEVVQWAYRRMGAAAASVPTRPGFALGGDVDGLDAEVAQLDARALALDDAVIAGDGNTPPMVTRQFRPGDLLVDPERFQFKSGGDEFGVTDRLKGVTEWNPIYAGRVIAWEDEAGRAFIADGHQRRALAARIEDETGKPVMLDATVLRARDGVTAQDARVWAALKNIAEGTGSAIDAAKVIRDAGAHVLDNLPPKSPLVRDGAALAHLSDEAFGAVYNGVIDPEIAAVIGHLLPDRPEAHAGMIDLLHRLDPANRGQAESIVRQAIAAGFHKAEQVELFGTRDLTSSLFLERAKVLERGLARLRKLKLVYGTAAKEADTLEQAGSKIARRASAKEATRNEEAIAIVSRLAFTHGAVGDALDAAARRLAAGEPLGSVVDDFTRAVRSVDLRSAAADAGRDASHRLAPDGAGRGGDAGEEAPLLQPQSEDPGEPRLIGAAERELAARFDDPAKGDGPKLQTQSLEHDARMDAEAALNRVAPLDRKQHDEFRIEAGGRVQRVSSIAAARYALTHAVLDHPEFDTLFRRIRDYRGGEARFGDATVRHAPYWELPGLHGATEIMHGQRGVPVDDLLARAKVNQFQLGRIGPKIAEATGAEFVDPGVKSHARVLEKAAREGYADPGGIKDLARVAFVVDKRGQGQAIVDALAEHFPVYDKGWRRTSGAFLDRKAIVRFPNGGVAEIQIVPRPVADFKKGGGHALYRLLRDAGTPAADFEKALAASRRGYEAALEGSEFAALGKEAPNAPASSSEPSTNALRTSAGDASDQAPPSKTMPASGPEMATGRSSSSNNLMRSASTFSLDMGAKVDPGKAARDLERADLGAAAPLRASLDQEGTMGLGLFDHADEPSFRLEEEGPEISTHDLLAEIDGDEKAVDALEACLK